MTGMTSLLVIDDDSVDRERIIRNLSDDDFHVEQASTGKQALSLLPNGFDCVLIDYMLPDTDGLTLMKEIQSRFMLPCVIITGHGDETLAVKSLKNGALNYIPKNKLTPEKLSKVVQEAVSHSNELKNLRLLNDRIRKRIEGYNL